MFYGWRVVGGTFVAQFFLVGFFTYSVSLLVAPVQTEFGVGLADVMLSLTLGTLFALIAMPLGGVLIDRFSTRWIMTIGAILFAAGVYGLSLSASITQYALLFGLTMAVGNALAGSQSSTTTISRWFTTSRGRALGISALGTSFGGIVVPLLLAYWIEHYGWRTALQYFSIAIALIVPAVVVFTVRGTPAEAGLKVEDDHLQSNLGAMHGAMTTKQILTNPAYWLIGIPLSLFFCVYTAILSNITPYATDLGHSTEQAGQLITLIAIGGIVGKLVFGFAADKVNLKIGLWLAMALVFVSFSILSTEPSYVIMMLATFIMGLAAGGQLPVWGAMMASAFGLVSYGRAMGMMSPLISLIVMPGFIVAGKVVDSTGSYVTLLQVFCAVLVLAAVILVPLQLKVAAEH